MERAPRSRSLLRERTAHGHHRVTYVELFFDLVFVFAITQISHSLLAHFTPLGFLQTAILMLAVWWVWVFTSWITNWLDPEKTPVRVMLFGLMMAGLLLSTSIPKAFETRGLAFALAYVAMQAGRNAFALVTLPRHETGHRNNFTRIMVWLSVSGLFWIAGGLSDGNARLALWIVALAIEYSGPAARFWTPGFGQSTYEEWNVEGGHMAERAGLFIIIALGESIVVTGATFSETSWSAVTMGAFAVALVGSIAMWWVYFHIGAEAGSENISQSREPGRLARLAYTYLHLPIVAGIVLSAVGDEVMLAHPDGHNGAREIVSLVGGPLLFLSGMLFFKHTIHGRWQLSHLAGCAALLVLMPVGMPMTPLTLGIAATAIMIAVAAWEALSMHRDTRIEPEL